MAAKDGAEAISITMRLAHKIMRTAQIFIIVPKPLISIPVDGSALSDRDLRAGRYTLRGEVTIYN